MRDERHETQPRIQRWTADWRLALIVVWTLVGVGVLCYFFGSVLDVLSVPTGIVVWTAVFVFTLRGPVDRLSQAGVPRVLSVLIAMLGLLVLVALLALILFSILDVGGGFTAMVDGFGDYMAGITAYAAAFAAEHPGIFENAAVTSVFESVLTGIADAGQSFLQSLAGSLLALTTFVMNTMMCIFFSLVVAFWLLWELPKLGPEINRLVGEKHSEEVDFFDRTFSRVLGGFIKGVLVQCGIIFVGCGACFVLIGVPNAGALAFIAALFNILPVLGQWIALVVVLLLCIFGDPFKAALAVILTLVVQRIVYTFVYPKVMADSVDVHPAMIIVVMMIGYAAGANMNGILGGLVGIIVAIPLTGVIKAVFVYYFERNTGRHLLSEDGVFFKGSPNEEDEPDALHNAISRVPIETRSLLSRVRRACGGAKGGQGAAQADSAEPGTAAGGSAEGVRDPEGPPGGDPCSGSAAGSEGEARSACPGGDDDGR